MPLSDLLDRAVARLRRRDALRAAAAGMFAAALTLVIARAAGATPPVAMAIAGASLLASAIVVFARPRRARSSAYAATAFERAEPSLRNLVVTAEQLIGASSGTRPYMRDRVLTEAARRASAIDLWRVVPMSRAGAAAMLASACLAAAALVPIPAGPAPHAADVRGERSTKPVPAGFTIDVVPPAYTRRGAARLSNPAAVDALAGSEATIRVPGRTPARMRMNGAPLPVDESGTARAVLTESGYLAIDVAEIHRLLPLTVTPDRAPEVRITAPGKDLRIASTAASIPVAAEAADDLGLQSLELRYTVVSGTGEQFSFTEGTLPATLTRGSDRTWRLDAALSPAKLGLGPGDALVYRATAKDQRPGDAGLASSDTFFLEVAGPGDVPLEGVEMPPDKERYALSEAMIVLKIERLQARERSLAPPALTEAAGNIAAEQRAVRANFVFLLGGEVEDEEVEAETSHEISEGRFANEARKEIVAATVLMGRVEKALSAVSTREALPLARAAVKALQRAFGHSRYLLRALPSRVRLDPARRLSGDLTAAFDWNRLLAPPAIDAATDTARNALADLVSASGALHAADSRAAGPLLERLAERLLAAVITTPALQPAAHDVVAARDALAGGDIDAARAALRRAAGPIVARAQQGRIDAGTVPRRAAPLAGAAAIAGRGSDRR